MTHVDARQRASTSVAAVVAANYQVGNNHILYVSVNVRWRTLTCVLIALWIIAVTVRRPVLNETIATVWCSTAPGCRGSTVCEEWRSRRVAEGEEGGVAVHLRGIKWRGIYMTLAGRRKSEGSFHETAPRNTADNTVRFDGSQPLRWRWKFGGRNNTVIFDNIDIGDLPTPIRRCSSRLRCYRFSMSDVYIGRTLLITASNDVLYASV